MPTKLEILTQANRRQNLPDIRPGDIVKIFQKIKETPKRDKSSTGRGDKERIQVFEGFVIARKHGKEMGATITVRKVVSGIGVEKTFPLHSPLIEKIEIVKRGKVRRAKLYYLREAKGKKAKLKKRKFVEVIREESTEEKEGEKE